MTVKPKSSVLKDLCTFNDTVAYLYSKIDEPNLNPGSHIWQVFIELGVGETKWAKRKYTPYVEV